MLCFIFTIYGAIDVRDFLQLAITKIYYMLAMFMVHSLAGLGVVILNHAWAEYNESNVMHSKSLGLCIMLNHD